MKNMEYGLVTCHDVGIEEASDSSGPPPINMRIECQIHLETHYTTSLRYIFCCAVAYRKGRALCCWQGGHEGKKKERRKDLKDQGFGDGPFGLSVQNTAHISEQHTAHTRYYITRFGAGVL